MFNWMKTAILMAGITALFVVAGDAHGRLANPVAGIAVAFLAPIAAMPIQTATSRTREVEADRLGADIAEDPRALFSTHPPTEERVARRLAMSPAGPGR